MIRRTRQPREDSAIVSGFVSGRQRGSIVLLWAAVSALGVGLAVAEDRPQVPTSVLLITLDTTRADRLGCYGGQDAMTPYLDRLAKSGARFEQALSPSPLTLPSHVSILTGRVPRRHGVRADGRVLDDSIPVLAERLGEAGFRTAAFVSAAALDRITGLDRGFDIYDDTVRVGRRETFNYEERPADRTTRAVLERIDEVTPPFFLWVHYRDPHLPYVPPEPFKTRFAERPYDGEISFVDWEMGGVVSAARQKAESLITIVAGNHGESLGEHGETSHGIFLYQSTQRVPLIVAGDGIPAYKLVRRNVGLVDIAPTILDLLELPPMNDVDGRSLVPALRGETLDAADYEMETYFPWFAYGWVPLRALVRGSLKYVDSPLPELYDLQVDRREAHDIARRWTGEAKALATALDDLTRGSGPEEDASLSRGDGDPDEATVDPQVGISWLADLETGRRALDRGNPAAAIPALERLLSRNPQNVPAMLLLGRSYLATGNVDRAVTLFRRALEAHPEDPVAHLHLAGALARKSSTDPTAGPAARAEFDRALQLNPRLADAYLGYVSFLYGQGEVGAAAALFRRARAEGVRDPDLETEIGLLSLTRGDLDGARAAFENAVALNEDAARALQELGDIAYLDGDFETAEEHFARALESRPSVELAKTLGALRLFELDRPQGALEAFQLAVELAPRNDPDLETLQEIVEQLEEQIEERDKPVRRRDSEDWG
jgi:arylsulfatase A-like enzyme/Tfp pilus assembly protein PilF